MTNGRKTFDAASRWKAVVARRGPVRCGLLLLLAGLCVRGFFDAGYQHGDYHQLYGVGLYQVPRSELVLYAWYLVFGLAAAACATLGLLESSVPERIERVGRRVLASPRWLVGGAAALAMAGALAVRLWVLKEAQVADEESTYLFIARTLLQGRVLNPLPADPELFEHRHVVLGARGWFGSLSLGHPLLLAAGEALGALRLVPALVTGATLAVTYQVGRRVFSPLEAGLGALLLLLSPQFLATGGTLLSQTTSTLATMCGVWAVVRAREGQGRGHPILGGLALGYCALVRPLPGLLFLGVAGAYCVVTAPRGEWRRAWPRELSRLGLAAAPVLVLGAVFLCVTARQWGDLLPAIRFLLDPDLAGQAAPVEGRTASSVGAALLRQSFWLFGWPVSLLFVPLCRRRPGVGLFAGLLLAGYGCHVLVPRTGMATTGPISVAELVPLLALMSGSGVFRAKELLCAHGLEGKRLVVSAVAALVVVSGCTFVVVQLHNVYRSCHAWNTAHRLLSRQGAGRALVFAGSMVPPRTSWSILPPLPGPNFDDDVVFVRLPAKGPTSAAAGSAAERLRRQAEARGRAMRLWRRHFADREAYLFRWVDRHPELLRLESP